MDRRESRDRDRERERERERMSERVRVRQGRRERERVTPCVLLLRFRCLAPSSCVFALGGCRAGQRQQAKASGRRRWEKTRRAPRPSLVLECYVWSTSLGPLTTGIEPPLEDLPVSSFWFPQLNVILQTRTSCVAVLLRSDAFTPAGKIKRFITTASSIR